MGVANDAAIDSRRKLFLRQAISIYRRDDEVTEVGIGVAILVGLRGRSGEIAP
jgi:hypothetical protein